VTPGAGFTTVTQSLAKRLAFAHFRPGLSKIRQTAYALGLEKRLSKVQILALYLDTVEMGRGPRGWTKGFFDTSLQIYGRPASELDDQQFFAMVAVLIAPAQFNLRSPDARLNGRVGRIERLIADKCQPLNFRDVWLQGCASVS
jgi:membrane peptidoglycan carboxypeptidase